MKRLIQLLGIFLTISFTPLAFAASPAAEGAIGPGTWEGTLFVKNPVMYQQILYDNSLCSGPQCGETADFFVISIKSRESASGENVEFVLTPVLFNSYGRPL